MDLGTIKKNLLAETAPYSSSAEVLKDVQQVWGNCRQYNDEDDPIMYVCDMWEACVWVMHDERTVYVKTAYGPSERPKLLVSVHASWPS